MDDVSTKQKCHNERFFGSITALVTPFLNGKFDEDAYGRLIERQISVGTNGLVVLGTTGESSMVSFEDHIRIIEFAVKKVNGRIPVIAGTGSNFTKDAVMLTQQAEAVGVDACLSVVPYYVKPSQEGLYWHFKTIAEATQLPIILYNVPGRTVVSLETKTVMRLAQIPNIIGIKDASGDMRKGGELLRMFGDDFLVFSGDDFTSFSLMMLGATGSISVVSNILPEEMAEFWSEGLAGNWRRSKSIHFETAPLIEALFLETNPIMVKAALNRMGYISLEYELPLCEPSKANLEKLYAVLQSFGLVD